MNSFRILERKKEEISLKINLPNEPINDFLRKWQCQNFSEIINQPIKNKSNRASLSNLSFQSIKNKITHNSSFRTQYQTNNSKNFEQFESIDFIPITQRESKNELESSRNSKETKIDNMKKLIDQNYTNYISNLKNKYPTFKFNHYSKYEKKNKIYKNFKLKINNQTLNHNNINNENNEIKEEYIKSDILDTLGLQDGITNDSNNFLIKRDFLERNDLDEINMIKDDLVFKTTVIDKELNAIIKENSNDLVKYIESNENLNNIIDKYVNIMETRNKYKNFLKKNYMINNAKLILINNKKNNLLKLKKVLKSLIGLDKHINEIENFNNEEDNNIKEISDNLNNIKEKIRKVKNLLVNKKINIINEAEKNLLIYEMKGEQQLNIQFQLNIEKLFNNSLIYEKINNLNLNIKFKETKFDLEKEVDIKNNLIYVDNDFNYENNDDNIFVNFLLFYNNIQNNQSRIRNILISLLDMLDIIIKDNADIMELVEKLRENFKNIIIKHFEIIQNLQNCSDKLIKVKLLSNCYKTIMSNYYYILNLFKKNFGLTPKIFINLTNFIQNEMNKILKALVLGFIHESIDENIQLFFTNSKKIKEYMDDYLNFNKINWFEFTFDTYYEFISTYFDNKKTELLNKIKDEDWNQFVNINISFQILFNNIVKNKDNLDNMNSSVLNEDLDNISNNENIHLLEFDGQKFKIIKILLNIIQFIYESIIIFTNSKNNKLQNETINNLYNIIYEILLKCQQTIINNNNTSDDNNNNNINNNNLRITEKEISLLSSNTKVIFKILEIFLNKFPNEKITNIITNINNNCIEAINELLSQLRGNMLNELNKLNFDDYPTFQEKNYNVYIKKFTLMKKVYDNIINGFSNEEVKNIFENNFNIVFDNMDKILNGKRINDDNMVKQFRMEMNYIKKVLKMFELIDVKEFQNKIEKFSQMINPEKVVKKRKKKKENKNNLNNNNVEDKDDKDDKNDKEEKTNV